MLNWDTNAVTYIGALDTNIILINNGLFIENGFDNQWGATFFSMIPINIGDDTICVLEFEYKQNWTYLTWDVSLCGFTNDTLATIPSIPVNGLVGLTGPVVVNQPVNATAPSGTNATFMVSGINITAYQWQSSSDGVTYTDLSNGGFYSNVTNFTLGITAVNPSLDGMWYRCKTTGPCGDQYSNGAKLFVVSTTPIVTTAAQTVFCKGTIHVPITVTDFYNVRDFNLALDYNIPTTTPAVLTYNSLTSVNADIVGTFNVTSTPGHLVIEFTGDPTHTANFGNGTLFELVFAANAGATQFNWDLASCEYLTPAGSPLFVSFQNSNFTVIPLPQMPIGISGQDSICNDNSAFTYTTPVNPNYISYIWGIDPIDAGTLVVNGNSCDITFDPTFTGTATITVMGANSCDTSSPNGIFVTVHNPSVVTFNGLANVCLHADPVTLTGGTPGGGTYSGPGVYNGTFHADSVGVGTTVVTYTYVNMWNCPSSDTTTITVLPLPTVTFTVNPQAVCYTWAPLFLSGGSPAGGTYSGPGVNSGSGIFSPGFGLIGDQTIKYTITGSNTCKNSATSSIHVDLCDAVNNLTDKLNFKVQPNPSNGLFEVNVNNLTDEAVLSIYNDLGQQVYNENLSPAASGTHKIDLSNQPRGMYFLMLNSKGNVLVDKIILK
jgi:hypothetical protein